MTLRRRGALYAASWPAKLLIRVAALGSLVWATCPAAAQGRRAALWIEADQGTTDRLRTVLGGVLGASGYALEPTETVEAARAFASTEASLDDDAAARLREGLGVEVMVLIRVAGAEPVQVQLRRFTETGTEAEDGAMSEEQMLGFVVERVVRWERDTATSSIPSEAPEAPEASVVSDAPERPAVRGSALPPSAPVSPPRPVEVSATPAPAVGSREPVVAETTATRGSAEAIAEEAGSAHVTSSAAPAARTMRVRVALLGVAGINGIGYGAGARLLLPLARSGDRDNALSFGIDLAATYDETAIDVIVGDSDVADRGQVSHVLRAFQLPLTLSLAWRVNTGAVVVTPRVGVVGLLRFGGVEGPRITGFRTDALLMGLLGLSLGIWLDEQVQLFLGSDVLVGPRRDLGADNDTLKDFSRFGLLLSFGVAL